MLPPSLYFLNLNQKFDFPEESDNYAMAGFSFSPPLQHYVCWVDQDREWVDIIKEDYTTHFTQDFFIHDFWDSFSRNIFSISYFFKRKLLKAQKIQQLSNSIQLGAFAQSTTFVLTSFFVIVQVRQYLKTSWFLMVVNYCTEN